MKKNVFCLILIFCCISCSSQTNIPSNQENYSFDLLLTQNDVPTGWIRHTPHLASEDYCDLDCAVVVFGSNINGIQSRIRQYVYVYDTIEEATNVYQNNLNGVLGNDIVENWEFSSSLANNTNFSCQQSDGEVTQTCIWIAQYGRCDMIMSMKIIPDVITISDMLLVVNTIDQNMQDTECFTGE